MRLRVPLTLALVCGVGMMVQFFIPHPASVALYRNVLDWTIIIYTFVLVLAVGSLVRVHAGRLRRRKRGWWYSVVTLVGLAATALIGIIGGVEEGTVLMILFTHIQIPMQATMFSLLAFFIASAAFRAFKARTPQAALLLGTAIFVMLGRVPFGYFLHHNIPEWVEWILMYPNMAAQRGILMGVGLGMISTALKIILGIERGYLGGVER